MRSISIALCVCFSLALFGAIGAVGYSVSMEITRARNSEPLAALATETLQAPVAGTPSIDDRAIAGPQPPQSIMEDEFHSPQMPKSPALRFGVLELLPHEITEFFSDQSTFLRATFESATAAMIEP
jgi:hypothetical protein